MNHYSLLSAVLTTHATYSQASPPTTDAALSLEQPLATGSSPKEVQGE